MTPEPRFSGLVLDHQGLEELELKNHPKTAVFDQIWLFLSGFLVLVLLRGIVAEPHKWCGTDFLDLASLDPLWNTPSWDIKNGILEKFFLHSGGLAQLIF